MILDFSEDDVYNLRFYTPFILMLLILSSPSVHHTRADYGSANVVLCVGNSDFIVCDGVLLSLPNGIVLFKGVKCFSREVSFKGLKGRQ